MKTKKTNIINIIIVYKKKKKYDHNNVIIYNFNNTYIIFVYIVSYITN